MALSLTMNKHATSTCRLEAIARRLEAVASSLEAIAFGLEAIAFRFVSRLFVLKVASPNP